MGHLLADLLRVVCLTINPCASVYGGTFDNFANQRCTTLVCNVSWLQAVLAQDSLLLYVSSFVIRHALELTVGSYFPSGLIVFFTNNQSTKNTLKRSFTFLV